MAFRVNINGEDLFWPSDNDENWAMLTQNIIKALADTSLQKSAGNFTLSDELNLGANHGIITKELSFSKNKDIKLTIDEQDDLALASKKIAFKDQLNSDVNDLNKLISDINTKITSINASLSQLNTNLNQTNSLATNAKKVADDAKNIANNATSIANKANSSANTANTAVNNVNGRFNDFAKERIIKKFVHTFNGPNEYFSIINGNENINGCVYLRTINSSGYAEAAIFNFIACNNMVITNEVSDILRVNNWGKHLDVQVQSDHTNSKLNVVQANAAEASYPHKVTCKVVGWKIDV